MQKINNERTLKMSSDYFSKLIEEISASVPLEEQVKSEYPRETRMIAAKRLTNLMQTVRPFSFIRMGDMEIGLLLADQEKMTLAWNQLDGNMAESSRLVFCHPGLPECYVPRLRAAYERATYVDFHEAWWINKALCPRVDLNRPNTALKNKSEEDSLITYDWMLYDFKEYMSNRRCLFAGGEADILKSLWNKIEFRDLAADTIAFDGEVFFLQEAHVANRLEEIKNELIGLVEKHKIDTLFISLGGAAKILCVEVAEATGICCFDFGSLMRAITYSGSDGQGYVRSAHNAFYHRVPFNLYMDAYEECNNDVQANQLLVKAQCQVLMDLTSQTPGKNEPTNVLQWNDVTLFAESLQHYKKRYNHLEKHSEATRKIARDFRLLSTQILYGNKSYKYFWVRLRNRIERFVWN